MGAAEPIQALAESESYEWTEWGTRQPSMRRFAEWLIEIGETNVKSIRYLRILHDEHACHAGTKPLTERQLATRVTKSPHIKTYRDRRANNATRYRVTRPKLKSV